LDEGLIAAFADGLELTAAALAVVLRHRLTWMSKVVDVFMNRMLSI